MTKNVNRRLDIDIARALAIIAVVVQHICQYSVRYKLAFFSPDFAKTVIGIVEFFHIPTFMLISGVVTRMSRKSIDCIKDYYEFEKQKFYRLMLPFFAISVLHLVIKLIAPVNEFEGWNALWKTIVIPMDSIAGHLWFLYCLMTIFMIWPILSHFIKNRFVPLLLTVLFMLAIVPINWPVMDDNVIFGLRELAWYLPIFAVGYLYGKIEIRKSKFFIPALATAIIISIVAIVTRLVVVFPETTGWQLLFKTTRMLGFISGGFSLIWLSELLVLFDNRLSMWLTKLGSYSYDIYLLHVSLVGYPLVFMLSKLKYNAAATYISFCLCVLVTLIVPIYISKIIRLVPFAAFIILGDSLKKTSLPLKDREPNS
jgi:peptidoglycan/LPS O-acetylase OafA/YrhL